MSIFRSLLSLLTKRTRRVPPDMPPGQGHSDAADPRERTLEDFLGFVARASGAERVVVWRVDRVAGVVWPEWHTGNAPSELPVAGEPMAWALDQDQPLRIEPGPSWARGGVAVVPVPGLPDTVLAAEAGPGRPAPAPGVLADAAPALAGILALGASAREARSRGARFQRLLDFLRQLPGEMDPAGFPAGLARAAAEITGAEGSVVATWSTESGQVVGRWGEGGGPATGTWFGVMESELAMAARVGATVRRRDRTGQALPLANAGERWSAPPRHVTIVPLVDATETVTGVIGMWAGAGPERGSAAPPDEDGVEMLEGLGPLLALQLRHSGDLVRFQQQAHEDPLTGLGNRGAMEDRLREERRRFHRYRRPVSLVVLDLDHFKAVNDTYGHAAGDAVLKATADVIRHTVRDADFPFRYGGEELVVVLPETMRQEAREVAERIRRAVESRPVSWNDLTIHVTASIGVSSCPECVDDPDALMRSADAALYQSKEEGRNRVTTASMATAGG